MTSMLIVLLALFLPPTVPEGQPVPTKTLFAHVPANTQAVVSIDVGAVVGQLYKNFETLGKDPKIVGNGPLMQGHTMILKSLRKELQSNKTMLGVDFLSDINYITMSVIKKAGSARHVHQVAIAGGKFTQKTEAKLLQAMLLSKDKLKKRGKFRVYSKPEGGLAWSSDMIIICIGPSTLLHEAVLAKKASPLTEWMSKQFAAPAMVRLGVRPISKRHSDLQKIIPLPAFWKMLRGGSLGVSLLYDGIQVAAATQKPQRASMNAFLNGLGSLAMTGRYGLQTILHMVDALLPANGKEMPRRLAFFGRNKATWLKMLHQRYFSQPTTYSVTQTPGGQMLRVRGKGSTAMLLSATIGAGIVSWLRTKRRRF